ncbi:hypothetical protein ABT299_05920 [Spirillospora sp. NPDC000708]
MHEFGMDSSSDSFSAPSFSDPSPVSSAETFSQSPASSSETFSASPPTGFDTCAQDMSGGGAAAQGTESSSWFGSLLSQVASSFGSGEACAAERAAASTATSFDAADPPPAAGPAVDAAPSGVSGPAADPPSMRSAGEAVSTGGESSDGTERAETPPRSRTRQFFADLQQKGLEQTLVDRYRDSHLKARIEDYMEKGEKAWAKLDLKGGEGAGRNGELATPYGGSDYEVAVDSDLEPVIVFDDDTITVRPAKKPPKPAPSHEHDHKSSGAHVTSPPEPRAHAHPSEAPPRTPSPEGHDQAQAYSAPDGPTEENLRHALNRAAMKEGLLPALSPDFKMTEFEQKIEGNAFFHKIFDAQTGDIIGYRYDSNGFWQVLDRQGHVLRAGEKMLEQPLVDPIDFVDPEAFAEKAAERAATERIRRALSPEHVAVVEHAMAGDLRKSIGAGGEASAAAILRSEGRTVIDLNRIKPNHVLLDLSTGHSFISVKTRGIYEERLSPGTLNAYGRDLIALLERPEPGIAPNPAQKAAEVLWSNRERLAEAGAWPRGLRPDASPEEITAFINKEGRLLVPEDQVAVLREHIRARALTSPTIFELEPGPDLERRVDHLLSRIESSGMTTAEYRSLNDRAHRH